MGIISKIKSIFEDSPEVKEYWSPKAVARRREVSAQTRIYFERSAFTEPKEKFFMDKITELEERVKKLEEK